MTDEILTTPAQEVIDDPTVACILAARKHFEDLRQVAAQLAGVLVLSAAGGKSATPDHPVLLAAERLHAASIDGIRSLHPTPRAQAHQECLERAAVQLDFALSVARNQLGRPMDSEGVNKILTPLQSAYTQLRLASGQLPGFQMLSFDHACCAAPAHSTLTRC